MFAQAITVLRFVLSVRNCHWQRRRRRRSSDKRQSKHPQRNESQFPMEQIGRALILGYMVIFPSILLARFCMAVATQYANDAMHIKLNVDLLSDDGEENIMNARNFIGAAGSRRHSDASASCYEFTIRPIIANYLGR